MYIVNKKILNIFILYIILLFLTLFVVKIYINNSENNSLIIENANEKLNNSEKSLNRFISSSTETLHFINNLDQFHKFLDKKTDGKKLESLFLSYVKNNQNFMQLRFIDKNGLEKIRVNRDNKNSLIYVVNKNDLQNKSKRYYFLDSKGKTLNQIWFTKLDKNIENNKIELPEKLTFRALLPIEYNKEFSGLLAINYELNDFIERLYPSKFYDLAIYNSIGNNLFNNKKNLAKTFPKEFKNILSKEIYKTDSFISKKFHLQQNNSFFVILKIKEAYLNQQKEKSNKKFLFIFSSIIVLSILLALGMYKIFSSTFSDLKKIEDLNKELEESKKRWQFAVEGNKDGLWDWNLKTNEVYFSYQWKKMLGFEESEIKNNLEEWSKRVHPDDLEKAQEEIRKHLRGEIDQYYNKHRIIDKNGTYKWILDRGIIVEKDTDGTPLRMIGTHKDINESMKLTQEIELLKDRFTNIFQEHSAIMLLINPKTDLIIDANKSAQEFYGYTNEEFKKLKISDISIVSNTKIEVKKVETLKGETEHFIFKHRLKNGEIKDVEINSSYVQTPDGEILFSIIKDITEKLQNEKKLDKTITALREAQKIAKLGIWELDFTNKTLEWSDEIYNIFELNKDKFKPTYETFLEMVHPDDRKIVNDAYENSLKTKKRYEIKHRLKLKNSSIKFVVEQCDTKFDKDGTPIRSIGTIYDITHLNELTNAIEQERYKYQKLMESSSDAIFVTDIKGNLVDYSKEAKKQLGYSNSEMHSLNIYDWDNKFSKKQLLEITLNLDKKPINYETIHKRKDGTTYYASVLASKLSLHQKDYIYTSVRDVTQQKELENKLQEQKEEFESIFKYSKDGIAITDLETNFLEFNNAYIDITGFTREELLTKSCIGLTVLEHKEEAAKLIKETIEKGFMENIEKECIVNNGKRIYTNMSASLLPDKTRLLIVLKDVTSIKQIEDQSRLIAMGEMIGNIAHQWRQPLSVISTSASGLKFKLNFDETIDKEFVDYSTDKIVEQTKYLSKTIDDFRNFIKDDKEYKEISVNDVIKSSINIVEAVLKNNYIKLILTIDDDIFIIGNKNELQQAIINIINNAKDTLKDRVSNEENRFIFIDSKKLDDDTLELKITDTAGGINKEIINRIFEPYFTTKHQAVGTGLGLAMVDKIIRERHGFQIIAFNEELEHDNKKYTGASFKIVFKK